MEKFLKITLSDEPTLNTTALRASNDDEMLAFEITASTADTAAKTLTQLRSLADLIEEALTTSWTNPVMDITSRLTYAPTAVAKVTIDWA